MVIYIKTNATAMDDKHIIIIIIMYHILWGMGGGSRDIRVLPMGPESVAVEICSIGVAMLSVAVAKT